MDLNHRPPAPIMPVASFTLKKSLEDLFLLRNWTRWNNGEPQGRETQQVLMPTNGSSALRENFDHLCPIARRNSMISSHPALARTDDEARKLPPFTLAKENKQ